MPADPESFVLRGGNYKMALLALFVVMTLAVSVPALSAGPSIGHLFYGGALLLCVVFDVRWLRAQVAVRPSGLQLRTPFRTYNLDWNQVITAEAVPSASGTNRVTLVEVSIVGGRSVKVDGVGEWSAPPTARTVQHAVHLINAYSQSRDGST